MLTILFLLCCVQQSLSIVTDYVTLNSNFTVNNTVFTTNKWYEVLDISESKQATIISGNCQNTSISYSKILSRLTYNVTEDLRFRCNEYKNLIVLPKPITTQRTELIP